MRSKGVLLAGAVLVALSMMGCAETSGTKEVANADKADTTFCQTDEDTGSRLHHTTSCVSDSNNTQQEVRGFQKGGLSRPGG